MKRPEKITFSELEMPDLQSKLHSMGYNQACDDWEKFLPGEKEITKIIDEKLGFGYFDSQDTAKAIHERLHHIADTSKKVE